VITMEGTGLFQVLYRDQDLPVTLQLI